MPNVFVKVPQRSSSDGAQFPGFGSAGIYWTTGETTKEVTVEQLAQLLADSKAGAPIMVIELPDAPAVPSVPAAQAAPSTDSKATTKSK